MTYNPGIAAGNSLQALTYHVHFAPHSLELLPKFRQSGEKCQQMSPVSRNPKNCRLLSDADRTPYQHVLLILSLFVLLIFDLCLCLS